MLPSLLASLALDCRRFSNCKSGARKVYCSAGASACGPHGSRLRLHDSGGTMVQRARCTPTPCYPPIAVPMRCAYHRACARPAVSPRNIESCSTSLTCARRPRMRARDWAISATYPNCLSSPTSTNMHKQCTVPKRSELSSSSLMRACGRCAWRP